jgi:DNA-binding NtrC family response regulator
MNILIIDDDEVDCISICKQISSLFSCSYAHNEQSALETIRKNNYDCILLDYNLNNTTGLELMPKIIALTQAPIIFVTRHGSEDVAVEALKNGAKDYIIKSQINYKKLIKSISNCINETKNRMKQVQVLKDIQKDIANRIELLRN